MYISNRESRKGLYEAIFVQNNGQRIAMFYALQINNKWIKFSGSGDTLLHAPGGCRIKNHKAGLCDKSHREYNNLKS